MTGGPVQTLRWPYKALSPKGTDWGNLLVRKVAGFGDACRLTQNLGGGGGTSVQGHPIQGRREGLWGA